MSREKMIEEIRRDIFAAFGGYEKWEEDWQSLAEAVYNAGYRKQSEGEWIVKNPMVRSPLARNYYCSACKYEPIEVKSYCPNCGAKMKGGGE